MLTLTDISLSISNRNILVNVNAEFFEGEIVGIIGKPSSGKTALLHAVAQSRKEYSGTVMVHAKTAKSLSKNQLLKTFAFQSFAGTQNPYVTLNDYLLMSRIPRKMFLSAFSTYDHDVVDEYKHVFELHPFAKQPLSTLSSDIQVRAHLAFHFIRQAPIVILDNPTQNLSLDSYNLLHKALIKYCSSGKNLCIIASHDINFLAQTVDKFYIMYNGTIADSCMPSSLNEDIIKKYFGTDVFITRNVYNGKPNVHVYFEY